MIPIRPDRARVMEVRELRTVAGPARVMLHAEFGPDGSLVHVGWTPPPPHQATEADRAALRQLEKIQGSMRNGSSIHALIDRTERLLDLLEALRRIEDAHGDRARELLAERAA
jgi:hypothetical protein